MKKLILKLRGYTLIDEIAGLWKLSYQTFEGNNVYTADYAIYQVYYNKKKDHYSMVSGGFRPIKHFLSGDLQCMVDFLNTKPENIYTEFSHSVNDYFTQKDALLELMDMQYQQVDAEKTNVELIILRYELDQNRDDVMELRDSAPIMKQVLQNYKKSNLLPNNTEIYEEFDNIIVTSEGYFVCTHKENINKISREDGNPDSEEE